MAVLHAAALLSVLLDESDASDVAEVLRDHAPEGFLVPAGWREQVANGLRGALLSHRRTRAQVIELARHVDALPVTVATAAGEPVEELLRESLDLTTYDAAYLRLAASSAQPLVTLDPAIRKICVRCGVEVLPARRRRPDLFRSGRR